MSIESEHELEQLRIAGRIVWLALNAMSAAVEAGVTTAQLDAVLRWGIGRARGRGRAEKGIWIPRAQVGLPRNRPFSGHIVLL